MDSSCCYEQFTDFPPKSCGKCHKNATSLPRTGSYTIACILVIPVKSTSAGDIPCRNLPQTLRLAQWSIAVVYLMKAMLGEA